MIGQFLNPSVSWLKICGDFWLRLSGYGRVLCAVTYSKGFRWVSEPPATTGTCQLFDKSSGSGWGAADHLISLCCSGSSAGLSLMWGSPKISLQKAQVNVPLQKWCFWWFTQELKSTSDLTHCSCKDANPVLHPVESKALAYLEVVYNFSNKNISLVGWVVQSNPHHVPEIISASWWAHHKFFRCFHLFCFVNYSQIFKDIIPEGHNKNLLGQCQILYCSVDIEPSLTAFQVSWEDTSGAFWYLRESRTAVSWWQLHCWVSTQHVLPLELASKTKRLDTKVQRCQTTHLFAPGTQGLVS